MSNPSGAVNLRQEAVGDVVNSSPYCRARRNVDTQLDSDATPQGIRQAVRDLRRLVRAAEDLADRLAVFA